MTGGNGGGRRDAERACRTGSPARLRQDTSQALGMVMSEERLAHGGLACLRDCRPFELESDARL